MSSTATSGLTTLSLHDALPIFPALHAVGGVHDAPACSPNRDAPRLRAVCGPPWRCGAGNRGRHVQAHSAFLWRLACRQRSEEHTSELETLTNIVCSLLIEKNKP